MEQNSTNRITFIASVIANPSIPSMKLIAFTITKKTNVVKVDLQCGEFHLDQELHENYRLQNLDQ